MALTKITNSGITDSAVTTAKIQDGTVVNADVASNAAIQLSKISGLTGSQPTITSFTPTLLMMTQVVILLLLVQTLCLYLQ